MEEMEKPEEVKEEVVEEVKEEVLEQVQDEDVKDDRPEANYKAELDRKNREIERMRVELERRTQPQAQESPEEILRRMNDNELRSYLASPQYAVQHGLIQDIIDERKFARFNRKEAETRLRLDSELERQKKYPDTVNPSHPMAIRMSELMYQHRLENSPSGKLVAAQLASIEFEKAKSEAAGRKKEQNRQVDVKNNFQGEPSRPAPKVSDKVKAEELKKKAKAGDEAARLEWFKLRGLIQ